MSTMFHGALTPHCFFSHFFCSPLLYIYHFCLLSSQVEFKSGKPPVLTFFDKASGAETESINLEPLTLDEVRCGACGHMTTRSRFVAGERHPIYQEFCPAPNNLER